MPIKSLENIRSGIRLLNVRKAIIEQNEKTQATVYVPHASRNFFLKRINDYAGHDSKSGKPKHQQLINCIGDIRQSVLKSFWPLNERALIPGDEALWVEVWLRCEEKQDPPDSNLTASFKVLAGEQEIEVAEGELHFPERAVTLIKANRRQLEFLITASDDIAEFRLAKEVASFYIELTNRDQVAQVHGLLDRTTFDENSAVCVCILDHGVNNGHLLVISAGNVRDQNDWKNYPAANITNEIHDPGQSWNALTVGAYTEKVQIVDPFLRSYVPIAGHGELSPHSTTSVTWPVNKWPVKPEIVFEGGNVAKGPNDSIFLSEDLALVSTCHKPHKAQFAPFNATSAASAQAAWMAAQIQSMYPEAWPETIRALMVHTAEWTDALKRQFLPSAASCTKSDYARLLRICGYGVPGLERALHCARNSLTLIKQSTLQPYWKNDKGTIATKDMHVHDLPWPVEALSDLGETKVKMRVTLSYFIEPGPGEIGWNNRYRYPSHLLRFEVNGAGEDKPDFVARVNEKARDEDGHPGTSGPSDKWFLGPNARNVGSIHSDIWEGTAADLAASNLIAVFPAGGWWKDRQHLCKENSKCRYSLVVSIETPTEDVDIYTPVAVKVGIPVEIPV
ncbi:MAG: S8 family serine peptidase [Kiritimatiellia bacterium]